MPSIITNNDDINAASQIASENKNIDYSKPALIKFGIYHLLLLLFIFSTIKTMLTHPGYISLETSNNIAIDAIKSFKKIQRLPNEIESDLIDPSENSQSKLNEDNPIILELEYGSPPLLDFQKIMDSGTFFDGSKNILDYSKEIGIDEERFVVFAKENYDFCVYCKMFRLPRTHHCKLCDKCVTKMDHHCEWLCNCIGSENIKYFMNLLFYGFLLFLFMVITSTNFVWEIVFNSYVGLLQLYFIVIAYLLIILMLLRFLGLLILHISMILTGRTTREFIKNKKSSRISRYNLGYQENLKNVFGENKLYWLLPI